MGDKTELHIVRLREGLKQLEDIRKMPRPGRTPEFNNWRQRIAHSLEELFSLGNAYTKRFNRLGFYNIRAVISFGVGGPSRGPGWDSGDQRRFEEDTVIAEQIIGDALEELEVYSPSSRPAESKTPAKPVPSIIFNINNVLSQTTEVHISQILQNLQSLSLSDEGLHEAKAQAKALSDEAKGQQRWPLLAKSLDALKALGKPVYETVAIPLLMEMLKKQAGL
jgi:hypothetical protein